MINITFHSHAATCDNEADVVSGQFDVTLSAAGENEAKRLGQRHKNVTFDAIYCSDLQRSYRTAKLAYGGRFPIIKDARLRECDYGKFTGKSKEFVKAQHLQRITEPFPGGESYIQVVSRMKSFLVDLLQQHDHEQVIIIGHAGTRVGLEYWLNQRSLEGILTTLQKQPIGTIYNLTELWPLRIDAQPLN